MGTGRSRAGQKDRYVAVIDQDQVTEEVQDIALKYDPLNRTAGREGFHVTDDGELHVDDDVVMEEHRLIEKKVPNDAIRILQLPAERGELVHQYGDNGFRLYELPAPSSGQVVGLLGPNGVGKTTALRVLAGSIRPNLGDWAAPPDWAEVVRRFRGTAVQTHLERLRDGRVSVARKPQRVDQLAQRFDGTVRELLAERDERDLRETAIERLDLAGVADRDLGACSGGERQRAAVAATLVADADAYLLDEPSSFLDVEQRLSVARAIPDLAGEDAAVLVVDHDLVTLDVVADSIHVCYGEPAGFGVVSRPLTARRGINQFLQGRLDAENVRIRETSIDFVRRSRRRESEDEPVVEFPELAKSFGASASGDASANGDANGSSDANTSSDASVSGDGSDADAGGFDLTVEPGAIHPREVLGVLGRNGLGKTTFARLLAGALEPDAGSVPERVGVSYKPQTLEPDFEGTVEALFRSRADERSQRFRRDVRDPLDLEALYDQRVPELSGGELQRVGVGLALARDAEVYLLDEPAAFLDVRQRTKVAAALRDFVDRREAACLVVEHDLMLLDYVSDRAMVFEGEPGERGVGRAPESVRSGIDRFLEGVGVTFRRDPDTGRPRANKPGSQKDREQKSRGEFYAV